MVHKGKHSDLWNRINNHIGSFKEENAAAAAMKYEDWFGNTQADLKAKERSEKHEYNPSQKKK
eukprot:852989-Heterocapsa_arctica.AAC.1